MSHHLFYQSNILVRLFNFIKLNINIFIELGLNKLLKEIVEFELGLFVVLKLVTVLVFVVVVVISISKRLSVFGPPHWLSANEQLKLHSVSFTKLPLRVEVQ